MELVEGGAAALDMEATARTRPPDKEAIALERAAARLTTEVSMYTVSNVVLLKPE